LDLILFSLVVNFYFNFAVIYFTKIYDQYFLVVSFYKTTILIKNSGFYFLFYDIKIYGFLEDLIKIVN